MPRLAKDRIGANGNRGFQSVSALRVAYWRFLRSACLALVLVAVMALTSATAAHAATITVNSVGDPGEPGTCDLRDAITNANNQNQSGSSNCAAGTGTDTIQFSVTGTIVLGSTMPNIARNLTITGPTTSPGITIDGGNAVQLIPVNTGATLNLQFLTLAHGSAGGHSGGAIFNEGTLIVTNTIFSGNNHAGLGGAIANQGTLTVTNSTFSGNQVGDAFGGAIFNNGTLTVTNSTFSGNNRAGFGGAIFNEAGTLTVTNSTFSGNQAAGGLEIGGAIYNAGTLTVTNCTFSGNQAVLAGAIFNLASSIASLKGTILTASTGGNCDGGITDAGYNISDDSTCNFTTPPGTSRVIMPNTDIGLDPNGLQNNGGPTQTIALLGGSPAIDVIPQASCTLTTDQRGEPRPDAGEPFCDIGAYEFQDFAGQPGKANCNGKTVSALAQQYETIEAAASALGFHSVQALRMAIREFCRD